MIALWLMSMALAQPTAPELAAWMEGGVEVRPDLYGETGIRDLARLRLEVTQGDWAFRGDGGLRLRRSPYDAARVDLTRMRLSHTGRSHDLELGRLVRLDVRGFQRLDGLALELDPGTPISGSAWAGRLWSPETWAVGETWVQGFEAAWRPGDAEGRPSRTQRHTVGWEGRSAEAGLVHRLHASASIWGPRGDSGFALVEVQPTAEAVRWRGALRGEHPFGRRLDLGADLRWEGLPPPTVPGDIRTAIDWLAPSGYAIAGAFGRYRGEGWEASVSGGPTLRPRGEGEVVLGGLGRAGARWTGGGATGLGLFASGAAIDGSWLGGGGGELTWTNAWVPLGLDVGTWRYQGLHGDAAWIWEMRGRGRIALGEEVSLLLDAAAGSNRQLASWVRGGLAIQGVLIERGGR